MKRLKLLLFLVLPLLSLALPVSVTAENYGAIAYGRDKGSWGVSWDQRNPQLADSVALGNCRKQGEACEVVVHFNDLCGAYASGTDYEGWGLGASRQAAEAFAMQYCRKGATDCELIAWACCTDSACQRKSQDYVECNSRNSRRRADGESFQEYCEPGC